VIKELRRDKMIDYGKWEGMGRKFGNKWEGNLVSRQQSRFLTSFFFQCINAVINLYGF